MKAVDSLLIAPLVFCVIGAVVGALTDIRMSPLFESIAAASMLTLALHWLTSRRRRHRSASADRR